MLKQNSEKPDTERTRRVVRRATNVVWHDLQVDKSTRSQIKEQNPCLLWFTGLSGAGKSTIADMVEKKLNAQGKHTYLLDGDNVRHGLNRDLGFTDAERVENIRRVGEVAKLFVDAGIITIASFISPFRSDRRLVRELFDPDEFIEVYISAPLEVCEANLTRGHQGGTVQICPDLLARQGKIVVPMIRLGESGTEQYRQIEFAGVLAGTDNPEAAGALIDFMVEHGFIGPLDDSLSDQTDG